MTDSLSNKRWTKPVAVIVAVALAVMIVAYAYASPYIALKHLKAAADARDAVTLNQYVDYPALRTSLKQQVGEMIEKRVQAQHSSNPLLLFGAAIGAALVGPLVDAYMTPDGVAALVNGIPPSGKPGEIPPPAAESGQAPSTAQSNAPAQPDPTPADTEAKPKTTAGYRSLNEFAVTWQHSDNGERYAAILQRHGLFSWKLAAVELNEPAQ